ncbi:MAG: YegS/Rv2252/BmrU family lipid kinase [Gemmatimonadota bacterium]
MDIELIIHTSDAGALQELGDAAASLRERSHLVHGRVTFERGDAERFAREATRRGVDLIITAGGDGTLNEVVNGILTAGPLDGPGSLPKLGIIPLGTANDFAGWLELPVEIGPAVEAALMDTSMAVDIGRLNGRFFLNVSTGGFGAEATEEASDKVKRALGALAYVVTGVRKFAALRPSFGQFRSNGEVVYDGEFLLYAVGNGCKTGGGNYLTPLASLTDGLLDLAIVKGLTHAEFLRFLPNLRSGTHVESEHVVYTQLSELLVDPEEELSVNADGEPIDASTFEYRVLPGALRLVAPPGYPG